jgi:hypothetical protein
MRETLQLLCHCWNAWCYCWRGHMILPHSCIIQVFIPVAWQQTRWGDVTRYETHHCSARRKHSFTYCCMIVGACCDVTVLAWRKYATIYYEYVIDIPVICNNFFVFLQLVINIGVPCVAWMFLPVSPMLGRPWLILPLVNNTFGQTGSSSAPLFFSIYVLLHFECQIGSLCYYSIYY